MLRLWSAIENRGLRWRRPHKIPGNPTCYMAIAVGGNTWTKEAAPGGSCLRPFHERFSFTDNTKPDRP